MVLTDQGLPLKRQRTKKSIFFSHLFHWLRINSWRIKDQKINLHMALMAQRCRDGDPIQIVVLVLLINPLFSLWLSLFLFQSVGCFFFLSSYGLTYIFLFSVLLSDYLFFYIFSSSNFVFYFNYFTFLLSLEKNCYKLNCIGKYRIYIVSIG